MKDEMLLKMSMITAAIGLFALFLICQFSSEKTYKVDELKSLGENEKITVYATVSGIKENDKVASMRIAGTVDEDAVLFKKNNESINISINDRVKIKGSWYNNKVVVEDIEKV